MQRCDLMLDDKSLRIVAVCRAPTASLSSRIQLVKISSDICFCKTQSRVLGEFDFPNIDWSKTIRPAVLWLQKLILQPAPKPRDVHSVWSTADLVLSSLRLVKHTNNGPPRGFSDRSCILFKTELFCVNQGIEFEEHFTKQTTTLSASSCFC